MPEVIFSEAHAGDEKALASFHRFDDPGLFTHEYWQYRAEKSVFIVGKDGDRIVATQAVIPYELSIQGMRILTGRSERTLVDATYRGHNIYSQIMAFCADHATAKGMAFVWGTTPARKPLEKFGYTYLTGHRLHMYAIASFRGLFSYITTMMANGAFHPAKLLAKMNQRNKAGLVDKVAILEEYAMLFAAIPSMLLRGICVLPMALQDGNFEVTHKPKNYSDIDALYRRLGVLENDIYLTQDEEFVEWMLINSKHNCQYYFAYLQGQLVGYIYVCFFKQQVATIIDFAFENGRIARALLRHVHADLARRAVAFIKITINVRHRVQKKYLSSLTANGFVPLYLGGGHVVLPLLYTNKEILNDISRWYLTDLWYMFYKKDIKEL